MQIRVERERRLRRRGLAPSLLAFVPAVTPAHQSPTWLEPLAELFERARSGEVRAIVSTAPQHGKSETCLHALCWLLRRDPTKRHAYATYAQQQARDQSLIARRIAERSGVRLTTSTADRWVTPEGGGVVFTGVGGPLTGKPIDGVLILDDLIKNRQEAESRLIRDRTMDWLTSVALSRLHPGASVVFIATRWHPDDPHGRLLQRGWEYVKLPAITAGLPLWPERRPLDWLERQRSEQGVGEYDWWSMYMCEPRPRGTAVFRDAHFYDALPNSQGYRLGCGADWAYTAATHADWSVAIEGRFYPVDPASTRRAQGDVLYLTRMIRMQATAPVFAEQLRRVEAPEIHSYMSGTEKALQQFIHKSLNLRIKMLPTSADKFVRAQPVATAWNEGRVLLPRGVAWTGPLLDEVLAFTGHRDAHDDIVDALASLWAGLSRRSSSYEELRKAAGR